jgi:hypothetical protein
MPNTSASFSLLSTLLAGTSSQVLIHRSNYPCESAPVGKSLLGELKEEKTVYFFLFFSARVAAVATAAAPAAV